MNAVVKEVAPLGPGVYDGLPMSQYLAMPAASASLMITLLDRCPRAAWFDSWLNPKREASASTPAQSVGTLAHALLLENSKSQLMIIDPRDHPAEKTGNIPDGWTNKSIRAARDQALADGKIPVFPEVASDVEGMVLAAQQFIASIASTEPAIHDLFQPSGGCSEVTLVWEEDGCLFRMRPDRLARNLKLQGDVKTTKTTAEPDRWGRTQLFGMSYYIAAAFYRRGLEAAMGVKSEYVYLTQEQAKPFLCSLIGIDPAGRALGDAKIERAMSIWKRCMKTGEWPAYPPRVAYPETPAWERAREEEVEPTGSTYDYPAIGWGKHLAVDEHAPIEFK